MHIDWEQLTNWDPKRVAVAMALGLLAGGLFRALCAAYDAAREAPRPWDVRSWAWGDFDWRALAAHLAGGVAMQLVLLTALGLARAASGPREDACSSACASDEASAYVDKAYREASPALGVCYDRELMPRRAAVAGDSTVFELTLVASEREGRGAIESVRVDEAASSLRDPAFEACVRGQLAGLSFKAPPVGSVRATLTLPFVRPLEPAP